MLQRICDRCGRLIAKDLHDKYDGLSSDMCILTIDIGPFKVGNQGNGAIMRKVLNPSESKKYELCKDCKETIVLWLTNCKSTEKNIKEKN